MEFKEIEKNLFTISEDYFLAHCISADYALGAGIAKEFNSRYNMREKLKEKYPATKNLEFTIIGKALLIDNVFNLVTKEKYYHKPTYNELLNTLLSMREQCIDLGIKKIAMPRIGCGLDKLNWSKVKDLIISVFKETDIEIVVCVQYIIESITVYNKNTKEILFTEKYNIKE